jgi:hypothetical protein
MPAAATEEEILSLVPEGYIYRGSEMRGRRTHLLLTCPEGHPWTPRLSNLRARPSTGCGRCTRRNQARALNPAATEEEILSLVPEGYIYRGSEMRGEGRQRATYVLLTCPEGHSWDIRPTRLKTGNRCFTCHRVSLAKRNFQYGLHDFRSGHTDPEKPLALYVYAWDGQGYGKAGIGRPVNFWERRHAGRKLHRVEVPALVASVAEEMLLRLLQGEDYRYGIVTGADHDDGKTERFHLDAYYVHRLEVLSIFRWAEDPASLDHLLSILHGPGIEPYFGPHPPTTPPTREPS